MVKPSLPIKRMNGSSQDYFSNADIAKPGKSDNGIARSSSSVCSEASVSQGRQEDRLHYVYRFEAIPEASLADVALEHT